MIDINILRKILKSYTKAKGGGSKVLKLLTMLRNLMKNGDLH